MSAIPTSSSASTLASTFTRLLLRNCLNSKIHQNILAHDSLGQQQTSNTFSTPEQRKQDLEQFVEQLPDDSAMEIQTDLFNKSYFISEALASEDFTRVTIDANLMAEHEKGIKEDTFHEKKAYFNANESVRGKELMDEKRVKSRNKKKPKKLELWGGMTKKMLTPELKLQLKAFELAHAAKGGTDALDHKLRSKDLPEFFQFGTFVEGAADYFQRRGKKRKATLLDTMVEEQKESGYVKERYQQLQADQHRESRRRFKKLKR